MGLLSVGSSRIRVGSMGIRVICVFVTVLILVIGGMGLLCFVCGSVWILLLWILVICIMLMGSMIFWNLSYAM